MTLVLRWSVLDYLGSLLMLYSVFSISDAGDTPLYCETGKSILAGQVPYRDFLIEYPPGALPTFVLPALFSTECAGRYLYFFAAEMSAFWVAAMFLTAAASRRLGRPWLLPALTIIAGFLLLGNIAITRYDAVVAFALAGAAWSTVAGRFTLAWTFLGFGTLAKLTPIIAAAALYPFRQGRLRGMLVFASILFAGSIPAFLVSPAGFANTFTYHAERGLHIESFAASILLKMYWVEGVVLTKYRAIEVVGGMSEIARTATLPVTLVLLFVTGTVIWWDARRGRLGAVQFPRYAAALLLAFLLGSKVLSPQFLIWLLPLVPLACRGVWGMGVTALLLLTCELTDGMLSGFYQDKPFWVNEVYSQVIVDSQRFLSFVGEEPFHGVHPLNVLLGRNLLLFIIWLAIIVVPARNENARE
jgi:hypothetical protein